MKKVGQRIVVLSLRFMRVKGFYFFSMFVFLLFLREGWAAQGYPVPARSPPQPAENIGNIMRQVKTGLSDLKHEVHNHESEIRIFEEKLHNQETSFEHLRQQV